ncbi:hypothetical protein [Amycolatopsis alba]|uniref:Uncharacterized protein n=1 Tax=Amycolatopsis alba DSM 44262 TaxID=1125972 RepID=A0A229R9S7_AMYAL|nr:hypothetical protein CFP75_38575 [Amycolatopsis alba DSM 44262]
MNVAAVKVAPRVNVAPPKLTGGGTHLAGLTGALALSTTGTGGWCWSAALGVWATIGLGTGLVLTPVGRVLRRSRAAETSGSRCPTTSPRSPVRTSASRSATRPSRGWIAAWRVCPVIGGSGVVDQ